MELVVLFVDAILPNHIEVVDRVETPHTLIVQTLRKVAAAHCKIQNSPTKQLNQVAYCANEHILAVYALCTAKSVVEQGWVYNTKKTENILLAHYFAVALPSNGLADELTTMRLQAMRWERDYMLENSRANTAEQICCERNMALDSATNLLGQCRQQLTTLQANCDQNTLEVLTLSAELGTTREELAIKAAEAHRLAAEVARLGKIVSADSRALADARDEITALKRLLTDQAHAAAEARPRPSVTTKGKVAAPPSLPAELLAFDRGSLRSVTAPGQ